MPAGTTTYNSYDGNGNTRYDGRNGATVYYNMLNLPDSIPAKHITYTYDATGKKLRRNVNRTITYYVDGIQYAGTSIDFMQTEEGRVMKLSGTPNYEYSLSDHLGNNRVNFDSNHGGSQVVQSTDYMPFGLEIATTVNGNKNEYLYNKKELQEELGLYDYGARFYDPVIARWTGVDPLAEISRRWSTYNYGENNPIRNIDPDGMRSTHTDDDGKVVAVYKDGDKGVYKHEKGTTKADVDKNHSKTNTSAGGVKMGETWTILSFADFDVYENTGKVVAADAKIDFNSDWATKTVDGVVNQSPTFARYAANARTNHPWDIKAHSRGGKYYGSMLYGKYASARDAGNFLAGMIAQSSLFSTESLNWGFRLYNQANNNLLNGGLIGLGEISY